MEFDLCLIIKPCMCVKDYNVLILVSYYIMYCFISSEDGEQSVLRWLDWLLENIPEFEKCDNFKDIFVAMVTVTRAIPGERVYGEMLLLIVIHLQEKQLKEIENLVSSVLRMKLPVNMISIILTFSPAHPPFLL